MARTRKKPSASAVPRWLLIVGGGLLVLLGIAGGTALDLALRPAPQVRPQAAAHPLPRPAPPVIRIPEDRSQPSSLFSRDAPPEETPHQPPPAPADSNAPSPMTAFAVPSKVPHARPAVAIVIDDMGLDRVRSLRVVSLGGPLTVSIMTYADDAGGLAARARAAGDEVLAHVPMQPLDPKQDPGPHALTVTMDDAAIRAAIAADLDGWHGYVGINNHMGSRFTQDRERMAVVMAELKARGLLWLDSRTTTNSVGGAAARAAGVPCIDRDIFLDNIETTEAVTDQLEQTIALAKAHGTAIAIGHPHETTIVALEKILPTLDERGVSLVPVTEILKRREESRRAPKTAGAADGPA